MRNRAVLLIILAYILWMLILWYLSLQQAHAQVQQPRAHWINSRQIAITWITSGETITSTCLRRVPVNTDPHNFETSIFLGCLDTNQNGVAHSIVLPNYEPCLVANSIQCIDGATVPLRDDRFVIQQYRNNTIVDFIDFGIDNNFERYKTYFAIGAN